MILASTLHDPENRLAKGIRRYMPGLLERYGAVAVVCSPESAESREVLREFTGRRLRVSEAGFKGIFAAALQQALRAGDGVPGKWKVHYCDLDRVLRWVRRFPSELEGLERKGRVEYTILGRTRRAFRTHPLVQQRTEEAINRLASALFGKPVDVCAGSALLSRPVAEELCRAPHTPWAGWWLLAMRRWKAGYAEMEGLEWETPERYEAEIRAQGYARWLKSFEPEDAYKRAMYTTESLREMLALAGAWGAVRPLNKI